MVGGTKVVGNGRNKRSNPCNASSQTKGSARNFEEAKVAVKMSVAASPVMLRARDGSCWERHGARSRKTSAGGAFDTNAR